MKKRLTKASSYSGGAGLVTKAMVSAAPGGERSKLFLRTPFLRPFLFRSPVHRELRVDHPPSLDICLAAEEIDWSSHTIKGTCEALEKSYFRLTCAPDPATVRPEPVLRRALERLLRLISEKKENFFYAQDQFKVRGRNEPPLKPPPFPPPLPFFHFLSVSCLRFAGAPGSALLMSLSSIHSSHR